MDYGKYIIVEEKGHEVAVMFDCLIEHGNFITLFRYEKIKSAGFFAVGAEPTQEDSNNIDVDVWGKSVSLNIEARKGEDEKLIKKVLRK